MRLGILGGGQLGKMTAMAALQLGYDVVIWSEEALSPAGRATAFEVSGSLEDEAVRVKLASLVDVLTLENEFIPPHLLEWFETHGTPVYPTSATVAKIQDKWRQKQFLAEAGLPVPETMALESLEELRKAPEKLGYPLVLKTRTLGYDGRGTAVVRSPEALAQAVDRLGGLKPGHLMAETYIAFERELAVMVVRDRQGRVLTYPVVETQQPGYICRKVLAPAPISPQDAERARSVAASAVESLRGVGAFGVELFYQPGRVWINEIAPRPHNSGHYSIEACVTSQFENHVRAVTGLSLGSPEMVAPCAVMVNLLGSDHGPVSEDVLVEASALPGVHLHLYGKRLRQPGRKMGHITVLGQSLAEAEARADEAARFIRI
ncbi:MAG: 5-(carboxyamino)imidazole ribonucleotide synthase [Firmicutes bacterium]|nr:5-(carboxyamino)imidazole ribonucleotide synthase [Bacillota bacterium]